MTVALVAATALLNFSGQVIVHAAAAFEAALDFTSLRSLLSGPAAFALPLDEKMVRLHAAAASAAAAFCYRVMEIVQRAAAACAAAQGNVACLSDSRVRVGSPIDLELGWSFWTAWNFGPWIWSCAVQCSS